jgi:hypothetical protein
VNNVKTIKVVESQVSRVNLHSYLIVHLQILLLLPNTPHILSSVHCFITAVVVPSSGAATTAAGAVMVAQFTYSSSNKAVFEIALLEL